LVLGRIAPLFTMACIMSIRVCTVILRLPANKEIGSAYSTPVE
jgi:hypothetical protein